MTVESFCEGQRKTNVDSSCHTPRRSHITSVVTSDPSYLHFRRLLPTSDGISFKGELVLSDHSPAVFVPHVGDHVHVWRPHLKLSLPVNNGGQGGADQKRTFGVTLEEIDEVKISFHRQNKVF